MPNTRCMLITLGSLMALPLSAQQQPAPSPPAAQQPTGRITGRLLDRESGRPLQAARIVVVGLPGVLETDLDGRYRTPPIPAGTYSVRAALIGYSPQQRDSVRVPPGGVGSADFALTVRAIELEELSVQADVPTTPKTDAGLLAAQQAAPSVSDGISAEAISRNPDSDGGDVIRRVTGVAVFDKKFVIVRGLNERYSTTQLNGSDLPSPEPLKKVAPLDIFPANLLESIVTTKTATPDKPGDFTGGAVEIRTKDFPEQFTMQLGVTQSFNSQTTFERSVVGPRTTGDFFGFGASRRGPSREALSGPAQLSERAQESFRDVWTGRRQEALPNLGVNFNVGGQVGERNPFGYVVALTYNHKRQFTPDKFVAFRPALDNTFGNGRVLDESIDEVEWGGIANFSLRVGGSTKFGLKNLYTRGAEETFASGPGYSTENGSRFFSYGVGYVQRELIQSQLSGEHVLGFFLGSRLEWRATRARATRLEPESRRANYTLTPSGGQLLQQFTPYQVRDLRDNITTGQVDLTIPFSLRSQADASLKVGGLLRDKPRKFSSAFFQASAPVTDGDVLGLPPELVFAPENVGSVIQIFRFDGIGRDYRSEDDLTAAYAMADIPLLPRVRLVGGVRMEHWRLTITSGAENTTDRSVLFRRPYDYLWSANLTVGLSDRTNLRFAGFKSITRPDPRELVQDVYTPVSQECGILGDTTLTDSRTVNADARWEYYPRPGELFAVSGFYKKFDDPLVEAVGSGASACTSFTTNGTTARNYGLELEARRALDFLPGFLNRLSVGANATVLESSVDLDTLRFGNARNLTLQGQSPLVINGSVIYAIPEWGTSLSILFNYFDDRIARYGSGDPTGQSNVRPVNVVEEGRYSLDLKLQQEFGPLRLSFAGTNVTNRPVRWSLAGSHGKALTRRYATGSGWSIGVTYVMF
jgi:hypothetical protein